MAYRCLIGVDQLLAGLHDPDLRLFDCRFDLADTGRGLSAHRESHLPNAIYAHLDRDLSSPITPQSGRHPLPDPARLCAWLDGHGVGPETRVVVYDDTGGNMAVRLWWLLRWLGHERVAVLDGGWQAWTQAGLPLQTEAPKAPGAGGFDGTPDWSQVVSSDTLNRQLLAAEQHLQLMDARTAERFRGEAEPIDPVAGHIPGAVNIPLQDNLDRDGRFRPADELHRMYNAVLGDRPPQTVVAMCGSGVTACHNLLAMELAGLRGGRLYAGSWSEWIRDPQRPVATGE